METRVPNTVFVHVCPMETAFAVATGMANHTKMALRAMQNFFILEVAEVVSCPSSLPRVSK